MCLCRSERTSFTNGNLKGSINAVSYTHLKELTGDIKGMKFGVPEEYLAEGLDPEVKASFMGVLDTLKELGAEAVSYTHLDVYKRQGILCFLFMNLFGTIPRMRIAPETYIWKIEKTYIWRVKKIGKSTVPVSYTHLSCICKRNPDQDGTGCKTW